MNPSRLPSPVVVICHMEGSGKWPHDRVAIRHIKAAFHISLGELLTQHHHYTCQPSPTHLDVWKVWAPLSLSLSLCGVRMVVLMLINDTHTDICSCHNWAL